MNAENQMETVVEGKNGMRKMQYSNLLKQDYIYTLN